MLPRHLRSPRLLLSVAALGAPLTLGACTSQSSGTKFSGAKAEVRDVVTKLSDLAEDREAKDICLDLFTERLRSEFAKVGDGNCAKAVDRAVRNADYTRLTVDSVTLNAADAKATAAVATTTVSKDGPKRAILLVHSDVKAPWLIDAFEAKVRTTTPPASTTPKSTTP